MRALAWFWAVVLLLLAGGAATLQVLAVLHAPDQPGRTSAAAAPVVRPAPVTRAVRIALPNSALQEEGPDGPLPRVAPDGWTPMAAYARVFDANDTRPRVGLLLSGLGLDLGSSREAIDALPSGVTLAISAYSRTLGPTLDLARAKGDELLLSLPMDTQDRGAEPGELALRVAATPDANDRLLLRIMSRFSGYVGATGASDGLRGELYAANAPGMARLAAQLAQRGLLYVDPRPGAEPPPGVAARTVDLVLDNPPGRADVEGKLLQLERLARERGSALGLVGPLRPVVIERLAAWARGLPDRGLVLAPVSALVSPPPPRPASQPSEGAR